MTCKNAPQFFRIRNFENYQHYRDRRPPWIKLYRDILRDPSFFELSDHERYHLIGLFLIASQNENLIPNNPAWLRHELNASKPISLEKLIATGWLEYVEQDASKVLAASTGASPDASKVASVETETEVQKYRDRSTEGETETDGASAPVGVALPELIKSFGEFGWCRLTDKQQEKLFARLNGRLPGYIERFDNWVNEAPEAKAKDGIRRKDRHAYESIISWASRDSAKGINNGQQRKSASAERIERIQQRAREINSKLSGADPNGTGQGDGRTASGSIPPWANGSKPS